MTPHIDEEILDRYAMGNLSEASIPDVEEHLLVCSFCQGRLLETDDFLTDFRAAAVQVEVRPVPYWKKFPGSRKAFWGCLAAATAALVILLMTAEPRHSKVTPSVLLLQSFRGPESRAQMASGRPYLISFDLPIESGTAGYEIEVVDAVGRAILDVPAEVRENRLTVLVKKLAPGGYWARVYRREPGRDLVAEYGLQVN